MVIRETRMKIFREMGMDIKKLKGFYIQQAEYLIRKLGIYQDEYSKELLKILKIFIENPIKDLSDMILEIEVPIKAEYTFGVNDTLFDICYPEADWMN